jgi:hypothetical protein
MRVSQPILAAPYFGEGVLEQRYHRLADVLRYTAERHCPDWTLRVDRISPPEYTSGMGNASHAYNTQKLEWWCQVVNQAADGDRLLLMDADMLIMRPLDAIWDQRFDLAYTKRQTGNLPLNGGVLFLRVSPLIRQCLAAWWTINLRFLSDAKAHRPWRAKYAGINQASFGYLLEHQMLTDFSALHIEALTCREWNCENTEWGKYDPAFTRIVHFKSGLRRALFGEDKHPKFKPLCEQWRAIEAEMLKANSHEQKEKRRSA